MINIHQTFLSRIAKSFVLACFILCGSVFAATAPPGESSSVQDIKAIAATHSQILFVGADGIGATVHLYTKTADGHWQQALRSRGYVGRNGIGKTREGDGKTPTGIFTMSSAFGIKDNPGTQLPYTKVTDQYYWVDDTNSVYYNKMIRKDSAKSDWNSGEHIVDYPIRYAYAIVIDYNTACVKGAGSGIFFHCLIEKPTSGCVSVPTNTMLLIMKQIKPDCVISIDSANTIHNQIKQLANL